MPDKDWKRAERVAAKIFGARRALKQGTAEPDILPEKWPFAIEVKLRRSLPQWLLSAVQQAQRNASKYPGRFPLVLLKEKGRRGFFVILDSKDFLEIFSKEVDDVDGSKSDEPSQRYESASELGFGESKE